MIAFNDGQGLYPSVYLWYQGAVGFVATIASLHFPRLSTGAQFIFGITCYMLSAALGVPIWGNVFGRDAEAFQLFAKFSLVFWSATMSAMAFKLLTTARWREHHATTIGCFANAVLAFNILWTGTYSCSRRPLNCWLVHVQGWFLVAWMIAHTVQCLFSGKALVQFSEAHTLVECGREAPVYTYVTGVDDRAWVIGYTIWNASFAVEHLSDASVLQDITFWLAMVHYERRDPEPRPIAHYFYEARAVTLGAYMTGSAVFGLVFPYIVEPTPFPWSAANGHHDVYSEYSTLPIMQFVAILNAAFTGKRMVEAMAAANAARTGPRPMPRVLPHAGGTARLPTRSAQPLSPGVISPKTERDA